MVHCLFLAEDSCRLLWVILSAIEGVLGILTCGFIGSYEWSAIWGWHVGERSRFKPLSEALVSFNWVEFVGIKRPVMGVISNIVGLKELGLGAESLEDLDILWVVICKIQSEGGAVHIIDVVDCPAFVCNIGGKLMHPSTSAPDWDVCTIVVHFLDYIEDEPASRAVVSISARIQHTIHLQHLSSSDVQRVIRDNRHDPSPLSFNPVHV
jgi:hypothetical protein